MKLSENTIKILKNFTKINTGISVKPGSHIATVSPSKTVLAEAHVDESFDHGFNIYDLNQFLGTLSLYKEDLDIQLNDKCFTITGKNNKSKLNYWYAAPAAVIGVPDKKLNLPSNDVALKLSLEDLQHTLSFASILVSSHVFIESDGKQVYISTGDTKDDSQPSQKLNICEGDGKVYKLVFKTENFSKLFETSYNVTISSKFISKFVSEDKKLTYWLAVEKEGSKFEV